MEQNSSFHFQDTTATRKVFDLQKRIRAVSGGTSASKTISILIWLIDYCQSKVNYNKLATVASESYPHLERGAILDFKNIMKDRGYWNDSLWNETKHVYRFEANNIIEFLSPDTYGKVHGPRRDVLFLNEANNLAYNIVDQLIVRTRETVWMDWNPTDEFWFYTDMLPARKDVDFLTLTYLDNEALDQVTRDEIESHRNNKQWWRVYGEGQLGVAEGRIYKDWEIIPVVPSEARLVRYGLDFGYSNDPTASDALYQYVGGIVIDQLIHQKGLSNRQLADIYLNSPSALIVADGAEPKSIDELRDYRLNIIPSQKGQGSVNQGIQYVQGQKIYITQRSLDTIKEYRNYFWMTDKDGKIINEPSPMNNHHMDDIRYGMESLKATAPKPINYENTGGIKPYYKNFPG